MIQVAQRKADKIGLLRNSISSGKGNLVGTLGEIIVSAYLNIDIHKKQEFSYNYDILFNGKKIEVKSKTCNSIPLPEYEWSIAEYNTIQECEEILTFDKLKRVDLGKGDKADYDKIFRDGK